MSLYFVFYAFHSWQALAANSIGFYDTSGVHKYLSWDFAIRPSLWYTVLPSIVLRENDSFGINLLQLGSLKCMI